MILRVIAGGLLVGSLFIPLFAAGLMVATGAVGGFGAAIGRSLEGMAPYADTFRILNLMWASAWVVLLAGLAALTALVYHHGARHTAVAALGLAAAASVAGLLQGTFGASVTSWAAEEVARTGEAPVLYAPLRGWIDLVFRFGYLLALAAMAVMGWSLKRTPILPRWAGSTTLAWSVLWLAAGILGFGIPALAFVMPALVGGLLLRSPHRSPERTQGGWT
jgi:hypothetical protein